MPDDSMNQAAAAVNGPSGAGLGTTAEIAATYAAVEERYVLQDICAAWLDGVPVASEGRRCANPKLQRAYQAVCARYPRAVLPDEHGVIQSLPVPSSAVLRHRVCTCHRAVRSSEVGAEVWISPLSGRAVLGGVQSCGSAWVCPVCAHKIAEHRREELAEALAIWRQPGRAVFLVTLTARHDDSMPLDWLLPRMLDAVRWLRAHRVFKSLTRQLGMVGSVRSTEITRGASGWHPHFHELWFVAAETADEIAALLAPLWLAALAHVGLSGLADVAVNVKDSSLSVDEYVTKYGRERKWDTDAELSKHVVKRGSGGSVTPFDLLRMGRDLPEGSGEYMRAWELWVEFAKATFGVHMMQWSRGLRSRLGLAPAVSDEDVAEGVGDDLAWLMGRLSAAQYQRVVDASRRGELLRVAGIATVDGGWQQVVDWLDTLPPLPERVTRSYRRFRRCGLDWESWTDVQWLEFGVWAYEVAL